MKKCMDELLPIIIDMLQDSSSLQKREVSQSYTKMLNFLLGLREKVAIYHGIQLFFVQNFFQDSASHHTILLMMMSQSIAALWVNCVVC